MTPHTKQDTLEAGCDSFESTLGLMDGTLSQSDRAAARAHADGCDTCGPMVGGWQPLGDVLRDHFDAAAELAKPDLAGLSDRVLAQVAPPRPDRATAPGPWARFIRSLWHWQPLTALGAAAVAVAVMVLVPHGPVVVAAADHFDIDSDVPADMGEVADEKGFHVHELSFGSAKGMVMTAGDDLPVIWVSEHDGA